MLTKSSSATRMLVGFAGAAVLVAGFVPVAMAQQSDGAEPLVARRMAALAIHARRAGTDVRAMSRGATVVGVAWTSDDAPIPNPRLHLRNLVSGQVAAKTVGNERGEFVFSDVDNGTYVIELVDRGERVKAVGEMLSVVASETVATFVVVSNTAPALAALASNAAAAAVSTAASAGVPPISAGSDVSGER